MKHDFMRTYTLITMLSDVVGVNKTRHAKLMLIDIARKYNQSIADLLERAYKRDTEGGNMPCAHNSCDSAAWSNLWYCSSMCEEAEGYKK